MTANEGDVREYAGLNARGTKPWRSRTSPSIRRFPAALAATIQTGPWHRPAEGDELSAATPMAMATSRLYCLRRPFVLDLVGRRQR